MVWYFYQSQNKIQKKKGKIKQKIKGKPYLSPRRSRPSQPTRPTRGRGVFFHFPRPQAAQWNATEPAGRPPRHQPAWSPCRGLFSRLETPLFRPHPFPPPRTLSSSPSPFSSTSESSPACTAVEPRGRLPPQPLPPCPGRAPSSSSSPCASNRRQEPRARRPLHRAAAGPARARRRFRRSRSSSGFLESSATRVSRRAFPLIFPLESVPFA